LTQAGASEMYRRFLKRPLDILLSLCGLVLLAPVLLVVAILVRFKLGSPVVFRQPRPGLDEKTFTLLKFRTMTDERDASGQLLPDAVRMKPFGRFLRSTSLDELPELWNILNGEMSLIGPRPLLIRYLPYYTETERIRHTVRPGLSGLSQISGRNALDWDSKLALDVKYVLNMSLLLDLKILLLTLVKVFRREGAVMASDQAPLYLDCVRRGETGDPRARP
jgi:undecaprenyl phosphate N,N'-diacetylbacillosamine 1-phosphate transferase